MLKYNDIIGSCLLDERELGLFCLEKQRIMLMMSPEKNKMTSSLEKNLEGSSRRSHRHAVGVQRSNQKNDAFVLYCANTRFSVAP